jgi:hypothetical protein
MKVTIKLDLQAIQQVKNKLYEGLVDTSFILGRNATQELTDVQWYWPRGESPRDIVDTGRLRASLQYIENKEQHSVTLNYPVDYAALNHEGGISNEGISFVPRPWLKTAVDKMDFETTFQGVCEI